MLEPEISITALAYGGSAGVGLGVGLAFIRWLVQFVAGRVDAKEARVDAGMAELLEGLKNQILVLSDDCNELRGRIKNAEDDLAECKRRHAESEAEVMKLKATLQGYGDARQYAQLLIAGEKKSD